jgi:hypothetical protein
VTEIKVVQEQSAQEITGIQIDELSGQFRAASYITIDFLICTGHLVSWGS